MAGHAQLKFVMTECSKTQIRLTHVIKSCSCFRTNHKSRNVCSFIDQFMMLEDGIPLTLPFISKTGQSVVQDKRFFNFDLIEYILAFYRPT